MVDLQVFLLGSTGIIPTGRPGGGIFHRPMNPLLPHLSWHRPVVDSLREVRIWGF